MKRSEKIEIRVSLDEKARLTALASEAGESVSGLIRGLVEKYVSLNTPSPTRRLPKVKLAGLLVLAAFVGHGLTLLPMHLHGTKVDYEKSAANHFISGSVDGIQFSGRLKTKFGSEQITFRGLNGSFYAANLAYVGSRGSADHISVSLCRQEEAGTACMDILEHPIQIPITSTEPLEIKTRSGQAVRIFAEPLVIA